MFTARRKQDGYRGYSSTGSELTGSVCWLQLGGSGSEGGERKLGPVPRDAARRVEGAAAVGLPQDRRAALGVLPTPPPPVSIS